eukprot:1524132-Amphidinium_carterae.1
MNCAYAACAGTQDCEQERLGTQSSERTPSPKIPVYKEFATFVFCAPSPPMAAPVQTRLILSHASAGPPDDG